MEDDIRYNRQSYVLGEGAMGKLAHSSVFLSGFGALGVEIAKNLVLAGVKKLTLHDTKTATADDLLVNFFLPHDAVTNKANRVVGCLHNLKELNPEVEIDTCSMPLELASDFAFLLQYQCVVLTEQELSIQVVVNEFCRSQNPVIKFVSADVFGILGWTFCDFGRHHEIWDADGEELKEAFISHISQQQPITVTLDDDGRSRFVCGDYVTFQEIKGMAHLNGTIQRVVHSCDSSFQIEPVAHHDPSKEYLGGGRCRQVKLPFAVTFDSLAVQLNNPKLVETTDDRIATRTSHVSLLTLHAFVKRHGHLPKPSCDGDVLEFLELSKSFDIGCISKNDLNRNLMQKVASTAAGIFPPLAAFFGGVVAQEVLKAVTCKFRPIDQMLYYNVSDIVPDVPTASCEGYDRVHHNRVSLCVGNALMERLQSQKVFLVGCGAIGCEMLKNLALLGVGTKGGYVTVTDHDLVERSNLTRQFLFRRDSLQTSKSVTAAAAVKKFGSGIDIRPYQLKVGPETDDIFDDSFFGSHDVVIAALDNVEGRRHVDRQCVRICRPLLESGTMALKGHVQVILPHVTESYGSQSDPADEDIPYCTLKSFPTRIEHAVQWAREKFDSLFFKKPDIVRKFWEKQQSIREILEKLEHGFILDDSNKYLLENLNAALQVVLRQKPKTWRGCVTLARVKFDKYFNHKAKHLLQKFPPDTKLEDGSSFWQSPRRLPSPIDFDSRIPLHAEFIVSTAKLLAAAWKLPLSEKELSTDYVLDVLSSVPVPEFKPRSEKTFSVQDIGNENVVNTTTKCNDSSTFNFDSCLEQLRTILRDADNSVVPLEFDKDNDDNGHLDFVASASNLRASMYCLEPVDKHTVRRISGRIIPAIITTTSAVAGLVTVELVRLAKNSTKEQHQNCFMNLALPLFVFSEPAAASVVTLGDELTFTLWDAWEVRGCQEFTLRDFLNAIKDNYGVQVTMILQGTKIIYIPFLPGHGTKVAMPMLDLVTVPAKAKFVELSISVEVSGSEEKSGPPVKYYF